MVFSSLTFLYLFLPLVLIAYALCRNRVWRNCVLLAASLVFYAWGEPKYILVMLAACAVTYFTGLLIERLRENGPLCRTSLILGIALLIGNLLVFKYLGFFADNLRRVFPSVPQLELALPIGISFYTFQTLSYLIDLYRGEIRVQKNPLYLALYVSFFPQLIAGPIVRYQTIEDEILNRRESLEDAAEGMRRFCLGLAKKVVLANRLAAISSMVYAGDTALYGTAMYWLAALAYTLEIYFDFSGYSDMAIGLGRIFGFHFLENFNYPYVSKSVTEFWRRWHISLSSWFRDYVYIPLGGSRVGKGRWILNILIVWALTGFWHGANWNFILWGVYYGVILLIEKFVLGKLLKRLPSVLQWLITMLVVTVGWVLFNLTDFASLKNALVMMFSLHPTCWAAMFARNTSIDLAVLFIPLGMLFSFPIFNKLRLSERKWILNIICLGLLVLCIAMLISNTYNPFIYFRF